MPLPLILGIAAGIFAAGGVGSGIQGGIKMKEANDTLEAARRKQKNALDKFEQMNGSTTKMMDSLGTQELNILSGFEHFSDTIEKIQNRPEFKSFTKEGVEIPKYDAEKLKEVSASAGTLVGGLGGAAVGTAGTLGTTILGATTLGVGLLAGGIIFNVTGSKLSDKADEAYSQACKTENEVDKICQYLSKLETNARNFKKTLTSVEAAYKERLQILDHIVNYEGKTDWRDFSKKDKITTQNLVLLVGMLYKMCQVQLVLKDDDGDGQNTVNTKAIKDVQMEADLLLDNVA